MVHPNNRPHPNLCCTDALFTFLEVRPDQPDRHRSSEPRAGLAPRDGDPTTGAGAARARWVLRHFWAPVHMSNVGPLNANNNGQSSALGDGPLAGFYLDSNLISVFVTNSVNVLLAQASPRRRRASVPSLLRCPLGRAVMPGFRCEGLPACGQLAGIGAGAPGMVEDRRGGKAEAKIYSCLRQ
jgi:hypothetical protein